jgi:hypothetical protein
MNGAVQFEAIGAPDGQPRRDHDRPAPPGGTPRSEIAAADYAARPRGLPRTEEQYYHLLGETTAAIERPKLEKREAGQTR